MHQIMITSTNRKILTHKMQWFHKHRYRSCSNHILVDWSSQELRWKEWVSNKNQDWHYLNNLKFQGSYSPLVVMQDLYWIQNPQSWSVLVSCLKTWCSVAKRIRLDLITILHKSLPSDLDETLLENAYMQLHSSIDKRSLQLLVLDILSWPMFLKSWCLLLMFLLRI